MKFFLLKSLRALYVHPFREADHKVNWCLYFLHIECFVLFTSLTKELKERPSQCITLALQGVGLSLVNNEKNIEVAYIGIKP